MRYISSRQHLLSLKDNQSIMNIFSSIITSLEPRRIEGARDTFQPRRGELSMLTLFRFLISATLQHRCAASDAWFYIRTSPADRLNVPSCRRIGCKCSDRTLQPRLHIRLLLCESDVCGHVHQPAQGSSHLLTGGRCATLGAFDCINNHLRDRYVS